ncbi:MAG TPA: aspartate/glutamate racemase family protein [Burkholderiaceae bacterium]|nr:aspartate/glutamate racemase family protein [Burkholderiaceae bacterium]
MRLLYQSFTDPDETRVYHERLSAYLAAIVRSGTRVDVRGMTPPARKHRITELRCAVEAVRNAVQAERDGYDAFVVGHFQDSGLWEARSAVSIPVIGLGESTLLHACTLARTSGLVTIDPIHVPFHLDQVRRYGLEQRVTGVTAVEASPADYVAALQEPAAFARMDAAYAEAARPLLAAGVELLIPAGGFGCLLYASVPRAAIGGVPLLNGVAVAVKAAEMAVDLLPLGVPAASRVATFRPPSQAALTTLFG